MSNSISKEIKRLKRLGKVPFKWKWDIENIQLRLQIVKKIIEELKISNHFNPNKVSEIANAINICSGLEARLNSMLNSSKFSSSEAEETNNLLSQIFELDFNIKREGFFKRMFKRAKMPLYAGLAAASIAGAPMNAEAQQTNEVRRMEQKVEESVYVDLGYAPGDRLNISGSNLEEYRIGVSNFFKRYRSGIERDEIGFEALVDSFARTLDMDKGSVHRIDFNNIVDDHRKYVELAKVVDGYGHLNQDHANWIKECFADAAIKKGGRIDDNYLKDIKKNLDKIPKEDYHIVKSKKGDTVEGIISNHYNKFNNLNPQQKRRVLDFIYDINPGSIVYGHHTADFSDVSYIISPYYEDRAIVAIPRSNFLDKIASGQK
jgi:hypothetical protein